VATPRSIGKFSPRSGSPGSADPWAGTIEFESNRLVKAGRGFGARGGPQAPDKFVVGPRL